MIQTALIDGDVLIYRAAHKAEKVFDWGNDLFSIVADLKEARGHYESMVADICKHTQCKRPNVVVSCPTGRTFRHALYPEYKAGRKKDGAGRGKPIIFKALRDELVASGAVTFCSNLEGDDVMGILQDDSTVICTIDKDLKTIPGRHFNFDKQVLGVYSISEKEAHDFWLMQCLAGDPTDGIPGIPGVGMKTAKKLLDEKGYEWQTVADAYKKAKLAGSAITMARLVRILDSSMYDFAEGTINLWYPQ